MVKTKALEGSKRVQTAVATRTLHIDAVGARTQPPPRVRTSALATTAARGKPFPCGGGEDDHGGQVEIEGGGRVRVG